MFSLEQIHEIHDRLGQADTLPQEDAQEVHDIGRATRLVLRLEEEAAVERKPPNRGDVVMGQRHVQDWRLKTGLRNALGSV